jgi:hypothetical protein
MKRPTKTRVRQACLEAVACDPRVTIEAQSRDGLTGIIRLSKNDLEQSAYNQGDSITFTCECDVHEYPFVILREDDAWIVVIADQWQRDARMWPAELVTELEYACVEFSQFAMAEAAPRFHDSTGKVVDLATWKPGGAQ